MSQSSNGSDYLISAISLSWKELCNVAVTCSGVKCRVQAEERGRIWRYGYRNNPMRDHQGSKGPFGMMRARTGDHNQPTGVSWRGGAGFEHKAD